MKIILLEPIESDQSVVYKIDRMRTLLESKDHTVLSRVADKSFFEYVVKHRPDVVFNLASIYGWGKTNLIPGILEITGVRYTGSGLLGLSLIRNCTKLFPLLLAEGVSLGPFVIEKAGDAALPDGFIFPVMLFYDGIQKGQVIQDLIELTNTLEDHPAYEDVVLQQKIAGEKMSLYVLDGAPFFPSEESELVEPALKAYTLLEARGLVRCDFVKSDKDYLSGIDLALDPMDAHLLRRAAENGLSEMSMLQLFLQHAGRDLPAPGRIVKSRPRK